MGNKRLTPHPSPLPQVEGAVHRSTIQQIIGQPLTRILDIRARLSYKILPSPDGRGLGRGDNFLKHLFTACSVHLNARKFLSNLVPQCLRASWKSAFTLAETLIVIGIIGVVAALTLPNLNHATGDKEKVTRVRKIYSALTDAFDRATAIYGPMDEWFNDVNNSKNQNELVAKRVTEFMKVSKVCGFDAEGCFSDALTLWSDGSECESTTNGNLAFAYKVILSDGVSLGFHQEISDSRKILVIRVDIDGPNKGKNQLGNDLFDFVYVYKATSDGFVVLAPEKQLWAGPAYNDNNVPEYYSDNYSAAWVLEFGNLDYLKCPDDLVNGQTSCK